MRKHLVQIQHITELNR